MNQRGDHSIESIDGRLRAEFRWQHDRFSQRLILDGIECGTSHEGDADESWPPSPPIQQLSIETIDGQQAALAVGAAGSGHWSLSAVADPQHPSAIRFELACRCKQAADFLGSSYETNLSLVVEPTDGEVDYGDPNDEPGQPSTRRVVIRPTTNASGTSRWSYRIEPAP